jgi:hypothetical protein
LLIGIDHYPNFRQLSGCINDVQAMAQILVEYFNFPESNVLQLLDDAATQEGIRVSWEQMLMRVGKGDIVVVQFSGHGSQMRDREGDEADGWDETIVPYDSGRRKIPNRDISDDEIYLWLQRLTAITPNITLIFDCCHSGTITRDPFGDTARWAPPDDRPIKELPPSPVPRAARLERNTEKSASGWLPANRSYTLFAGCRSDESSHEIRVDKEGHTQGVLTYFLARELRKARPGTTYRDVFEAVAPRVTATYRSQHPQLEGSWDREIFGLSDFEPMRFIPVRDRMGERVSLGAGLASGVTEGSTWSVYRAATKSTKGKVRLGSIEVVEVRGVTSFARVLAETSLGAVEAGTRAVEETRKEGHLSLSVEVVATGRYEREAGKLLEEIGRSPILRTADKRKKGDVRVYLLAPRKEASLGEPVPRLGALTRPTWAAVGRSDDLLLPLHTLGEPGVVGILRENLEKLARYRYGLALEDPEGPLQGTVSLSLLRRRRGGSWVGVKAGSDNEVEFHEGDCLAFKVTNNASLPLYLAVLDFGLTGRVGLVYPAGRVQDPLRPGRTLNVGTRPGEEMTLEMPEEFPLNPWDSREAGGVETLKLFATAQEFDPDLLTQQAFRDAGEMTSLEQLLGSALSMSTARDLAAVQIRPGEDLWTTIQCSFRLKPRSPMSKLSAEAVRRASLPTHPL